MYQLHIGGDYAQCIHRYSSHTTNIYALPKRILTVLLTVHNTLKARY
jgi:hypothetical protein